MPNAPAVPKVDVQEHLKRWRLDAARVEKLWDRIGNAGSGAGEVVEILDWAAENEAELTREEDALARRRTELTRQERLALKTRIKFLHDNIERYEEELDEYPHDVRRTVERAYNEATEIGEDLVDLQEDCEEHKLENKREGDQLHRLKQHAEQIRSELVQDVQKSRASEPSQREASPSRRQVSPPYRPRRIIRPEDRRAAYESRRGKRSSLVHVESAENVLAKLHSRLGYRQMRRYSGVG
ncbi:hypothetical protein RTBOTA2_006931 [Rhodotorula toruloides]|uniref:Uncharacterized protein n=1 Tax=Rhodotorula toruloides TaxID=5286 RepID=A0A2T0ABS0_RHOTO|nr:hypothetical protein RTBOTA2_006931 [Rhodotorula toruloides]PRQ75458.1 hypothetical protein AAT19DRAFT_13515 [Rhodotorula toruloides]